MVSHNINNSSKNSYSLQQILIDLGFLVLGAVLFALSHPNPLVVQGIGPLGFFVLLPVAWVLSRVPLGLSVLYGAFYGWLSYALFNYWLAVFNPVAWVIVPLIYLSYHLVLFPVLALVLRWRSNFSFWLAGIVWVSYEYLRTQGYLGYSYGILGYTQYEWLTWIQSADIGGVWLTTFLVVMPAFLINQLLITPSSRNLILHGIVLSLLIMANLIYGLLTPMELKNLEGWRVALIQHNIDPWKGGLPQYKLGFERLKILTLDALKQNPDVVIWSETAFVPSIEYHKRYRPSPETWELVNEFLEFSKTLSVPLILGNGHGELVTTEEGRQRHDANAALIYEQGELKGIYKKVHLVPFTEHFPYRNILPWFYDFLVANDIHFWVAGTDWTLLDVDGVKVGTPICFEDTFGYLNREFVLRQAQVLVNLTNDSWSNSRSSMRQHYSMAVFRAVENRRSLVRATNGGWTAAVDPNGEMLADILPLTEDFLVVEIPLVDVSRTTLYTRWGDWLAYLFLTISVFSVFLLIFLRLTKGRTWFSIE